MTEKEIADALTSRLGTMAGVPPIAWENKAFAPGNSTHLRYEIVRAAISDATMAGSRENHRGFMMVNVMSPLDKFDTEGLAVAQSIKARFPHSLRIAAGDGYVNVMQPPSILQGFKDGEFWRTPVRIPYEAV